MSGIKMRPLSIILSNENIFPLITQIYAEVEQIILQDIRICENLIQFYTDFFSFYPTFFD